MQKQGHRKKVGLRIGISQRQIMMQRAVALCSIALLIGVGSMVVVSNFGSTKVTKAQKSDDSSETQQWPEKVKQTVSSTATTDQGPWNVHALNEEGNVTQNNITNICADDIIINAIIPNSLTESVLLDYELSGNGNVDIQVYTTSGTSLIKKSVPSIKGHNFYSIHDSQALQSGVYYVSLCFNGKNIMKKIVKV